MAWAGTAGAETLEVPSPGATLRVPAWNAVEVVDDGGAVLFTVTGLRFGGETRSGTARVLGAAEGGPGVEVAYQGPAPKDGTPAPSIVGRFIPAAGRIDVQFDLSGYSATGKPGRAMLGRLLPPGAIEQEPAKLGLWQRHAYGGVPYEIPDGKLVRYQVGGQAVALAFPPGTDIHPELHDGASQHVGVTTVAPGHYAIVFSILVAPEDWPVEGLAARWHERPLGLGLDTGRLYNWWTDNKDPLPLVPFLVNVSKEARQVELSYWVRNFAGEIVAQEQRQVTLQPGEENRDPIPVRAAPRDLLFVEVSAKDLKTGREVFARTNLTVLPPHDFKSTSDDSLFGISAYWPIPTEADAQRVLKRLGVRWVRDGDPRRLDGMMANHASHARLDMPQPQRDEFIRKELQTCVDNGNPYWEFMNEINFAGGGIGMGDAGIGKATAVSEYIQWLKDIRRVQQETGMTQVKLLSAGLAGMDVVFVQKLRDAGGWDLFDGFALHPGRGNFTADYGVSKPYSDWEGGAHGNYWNYYGSVRTANEVLQKYGPKPLFLTEVYAPTFPNSWWEDSQRAAAENIVLELALAKAEGVRCFMFYQLFDTVWFDKLGVNPKDREYYFGMINRDLSFKPVLLGYCAIAEALDQAQFVRHLKFKSPLDRGLLFSTPRGPVAVLWNRADGYILTEKAEHYASPEPWVDTWKTRAPLDLPVTGDALTVRNAIGQERTVAASGGTARIELTGAPVIVTGIAEDRLP